MPALEPNPTGGQRTLLLILGVMLAVSIVIGVIASIAAGH
ncbi:SGM_5486 family transporter-associated protein [Streptomyces sp. NPDC059853]